MEFQRTHNSLKEDFEALYRIADSNRQSSGLNSTLVRSCCREFMAFIEADIYLINQFNPYLNYDDKHYFVDKFKKTFKHHAADFDKKPTVQRFQARWYRILLKIKGRRDQFTHPKNKASLAADVQELDELYEVYGVYCEYVNEMMHHIGVSAVLPWIKNH